MKRNLKTIRLKNLDILEGLAIRRMTHWHPFVARALCGTKDLTFVEIREAKRLVELDIDYPVIMHDGSREAVTTAAQLMHEAVRIVDRL